MKSDKLKATFLELLSTNGGNISVTCKTLKVRSRQTIYNWLKDEEFSLSVQEIREGAIDNVESALYKAALDGNVTAQIFMLKTQGKSRGYIETMEITERVQPKLFNKENPHGLMVNLSEN